MEVRMHVQTYFLSSLLEPKTNKRVLDVERLSSGAMSGEELISLALFRSGFPDVLGAMVIGHTEPKQVVLPLTLTFLTYGITLN